MHVINFSTVKSEFVSKLLSNQIFTSLFEFSVGSVELSSIKPSKRWILTA